MKTPSDQLFLLIKALSPQEKLFFRTFYGKKGQDEYSYISLYKTLNKMSEYNEALLKRNLKQAGFSHNLNKSKNYLTEAILKSLSDYHVSTSVDAQIQYLTMQAEILYKKNLKRMAYRLIKKAEMLSLDYEKHESLLMLYSLKGRMILEPPDFEGLEEFAASEIEKQDTYLKSLENTIGLRNLAIKIRLLDQSPQLKSGDNSTRKKLESLFNNPLLKSSKRALNFTSKKYFYFCHFSRFINEGNLDKRLYLLMKEWVEYLEAKGENLKNIATEYIKALNFLLAAALYKKEGKELESIFATGYEFYKSLSQKNMDYSLKYEFLELFGNYSAGQLKLLNPEAAVKTFTQINKPTLTMAGFFNISLCYFLLGSFSEALRSINKITNYSGHLRTDIQAIARLLSLIIHYELKNGDMLPYAAKASERWLVKKKYPLRSFDKALLHFFKYKLPKIVTAKDEKKQFATLLNHLKSIENTDYSILKDEIDMVSWLESKIQNRPFADVVKEKMIKS